MTKFGSGSGHGSGHGLGLKDFGHKLIVGRY